MMYIFFFKQKTAYEIKECDWSSDVCSSDLFQHIVRQNQGSQLLGTLLANREERLLWKRLICREFLGTHSTMFLVRDDSRGLKDMCC